MTDSQKKEEAKIVSIWTWVGMVLGIYGIILTGMGIYYVFVPETKTATAAYNPSLWWGIIMVISAAIFLGVTRFSRAGKDGNKTGG